MGLPGFSLSMFWPLHSLRVFLLLCCLSLLKPGFAASSVSNQTDLIALLAFKASIQDDPLQAMSSWNNTIHFCQWQGVTCGSRHQRVVALDLQSKELVGPISPHIGNLSFLRKLQLQNNSFTREIPPEVGYLSRLTVLRLNNNSISGQIPANISRCPKLVYFDLSYNGLVGEVPKEIGILSELKTVIIHNNNLTGSILPLANLTSLQELSAAENKFDGSIPDNFGRLKNLRTLALGINSLSGVIPLSLFNLTSLSSFDVTGNQIEGNLPDNLGYTLPNLEFFNVGDNQFTGSFPVSLSNASNLHYLIMVQNRFTGKVPNLERLNNLEWLSISDNQLGSGDDDDLSFLSSLINATNLQVLGVNMNNFGGILPDSIGNLTTNLQVLYLDNNQIYGRIPSGIVNLINLESLNAQGNQLTGNLPAEIGKLQNLQDLNLINNMLSGNIPSSLGNLSLLSSLILGTNSLEGTIPSSIGQCTNLQLLFLARNNLSGDMPKEVVGISSLSTYLDLSHNQLTGSLPSEVGNLINLGSFDVSDNLLSGEIPSTLSKCIRLETLRLGNNFFQGKIPSTLYSLRGIQKIDLSNNNFSGEIPEFLDELDSLQKLNLSFNNFEGSVPTKGVFKNASEISVVGNGKLCGGIAELHLSDCNFKKGEKSGSKRILIMAISVPLGVLSLSLVACILYLFWFKKTKKDSYLVQEESLLRVSYQSLLKATDRFSSSNLIGVGSFGSVYRGILDGKIIAVKVLNLLRQGASKSFMSECETLRNIRHRNLVKVLTACSAVDFKGNDFKALVYEFMINGSLEEWLHPSLNEGYLNEDPRKKLNFLQRLDISIDVACALNYLHNEGQTQVVHCDLKPSNILLDKEMAGHVGDFGLAKFLSDAKHDLSTNDTSSIGVRGSIGYTAPEYGMGSEVSTQGDVYSFGILLLEMFTGKRPTHEMFKDGVSLHSFVKEALPGNTSTVADPSLLSKEINKEEERGKFSSENQSFVTAQNMLKCLNLIFEIGLACSLELPRERMEISDVISKLHFIKDTLLGNEILGER